MKPPPKRNSSRESREAADESLGDNSAAVLEFLIPLARHLVAAGLSQTQFSRLVTESYFRAAVAEARFRNDRINQTAVAVMTGLTRRRVRELMKESAPSPVKERDRLSKVLAGWATDPEYLSNSYSPRPLGLAPRGAFESLVRRYGGDVTPKAMLREMLRHGLVAVEGNRAIPVRPTAESQSSQLLKQLSYALARVATAPKSATRRASPLRVTTLEVAFPTASGAGRIVMQRRMAKALRAFIEDVRAAGIATSLQSPAVSSQKGWETRSRLVLVTQDGEQ